MQSADPTGLHDWHSDEYVQDWIDRQTDREREVQLRRMIQLIPHDPDGPIRVLDIGGGNGLVTQAVFESFPKAQVVLHDYSEPMLAAAARSFASVGSAIAFARSDLMEPDWVEALDGQFDAVVSSIAIHNVRFPERVRDIYHETFPLVRPGGCFLNLDQLAVPGSLVGGAIRYARLMSRRFESHAATGRWRSLAEIEAEQPARRRERDSRPTPAPAEEQIAAQEPATLVNQLRWLTEAGYAEVECFWREGNHAIIGGFRAPR